MFTKTCSTLLIKADNISDIIIWETISTLSKENTEFLRELIVSGTYIFDFLYKIAKQVNFSKECYLNYNSPFIIYNTFLGNIKGNLFEKKNVEYFDNDGWLCALMVLGNYDPSNVVVLTSDAQTMFATPALIEDWIQKNCGFDLDSMDIVELCGKYNLASKLLELVRPVDESLKLQEKNFTKMRIM